MRVQMKISEDRRRSQRRQINRTGKIHLATGTLPRDCLITDISAGGVRLHVEGYEVPDEFVLLLSGDGMAAQERSYRVIWRLGYEIGAKFLGYINRSSMAARI